MHPNGLLYLHSNNPRGHLQDVYFLTHLGAAFFAVSTPRHGLNNGTPKARGEGFLIGVLPFAGMAVREGAEKPASFYKKWGFLGHEVFVNKFALKQESLQRTALAPQERRLILHELFQRKRRITISDYLEACHGLISRRIAQMDLEAMQKVRAEGKTRGRMYSLDMSRR